MSIPELQKYTFIAKYARWNQEEKRRETWKESVNRVKEMMLHRYPQISSEIDEAYDSMYRKEILGSQRALQFGGKPIESKNARMFNCLAKNTEFITTDGVKTFEDFNDGDEIKVLTHKGNWKKAVVKSYGKDILYKIKVKRLNATHVIYATKDHRWILNDGSETTELNVGDKLRAGPDIFHDFDYDNAEPLERLYWAYGFVYGDGTKTQNKNGDYKHSMVRLCGNDVKFEYRFLELGFSSSSCASINGDIICFTGKYLKTLPDATKDSPAMIRAFVAGYLDADGTKNRNFNRSSYKKYDAIQASHTEQIDFIKNYFPMAGVYIVSEADKTGQVTNYGIRPATSLFRINDAMTGGFNVQSIEKYKEDEVWCLEVEDDHSFVMPFGLVTGNCTSSYCDRLRFFQEALYLLLCGCGTGFSVQKHHIAKLPEFKHDSKATKKYIVPDTIEGWSDSLGVLLSSYFADPIFKQYANCNIEFDFSKIREAGAYLSSSSGKAPGPEPLKKALDKIRQLLDRCLVEGKSRLSPIDAYDIVMHASDAVLAGGVRRSACLCIFSLDDDEMMKAKTGSWFHENPQRGRSNNSALLIRDRVSNKQFDELMQYVKEFGEPGFIWAEDEESLFNPCLTGDMRLATDGGMIKMVDLYNKQQSNHVIIDNRVDKNGIVEDKNFGTKYSYASPVKLTQVNADVFEVVTDHGHRLRVTDNHEFPTKRGKLALKDMVVGDTILLQSDIGGFGEIGTYEQGVLLGIVAGDGTSATESRPNNPEYHMSYIDIWTDDFDQLDYIKRLVNDQISLLPDGESYNPVQWMDQTDTENSQKKRIGGRRLFRVFNEVLGIQHPKDIKERVPECVWQGTRDFVSGYLQGLFFADGTVSLTGKDKKSTLSLRLNQSNRPLLEEIQVLLQNFGISSKIYSRRDAGKRMLPDGKGGRQLYNCKQNFELIVNRPNILTFISRIGLIGRKHGLLNTLLDARGIDCNKPERFIAKIKSIEPHSKQDVYCITEYETNSIIVNGCVTGNCVEIGLYGYNDKGESGWQGCNLSTINCGKIKTEQDFYDFCRFASIIGTCQAGFTDLKYLGKVSEEIFNREALLGVSMTGIAERPEIVLSPEIQRKGAEIVRSTNERIAKLIGINQAARTTCVKPEGTTSCVLGTSSGIHPHHAKRYFRTVQANALEAPYQVFRATNPLACEKSVWSANNTDEVIRFCVEVPDGSKLKNQVSAIELLTDVKTTYQNWVLSGKNSELCTQPWLNHNVSNTITVKPEEWDEVTEFIYKNRECFAGISLLPLSGDKDYPQAPFTTVYTAREIQKMYGDASMFASGIIEGAINAYDNNLWRACDAILGLTETDGLSQQIWIARAKQFAQRYFDNDCRAMTYCLKDIHNLKLWNDLKREYRPVDYTQVIEHEDFTAPLKESACGGGQCEII